MRITLVILLLVILVVFAALVFGGKAGAVPCPNSDPRTCQLFGDTRDSWLLSHETFGAGDGDLMLYATNGLRGSPLTQEYACENTYDDDLDGKVDFVSPPGYQRDPGCSIEYDNSEDDGNPEPPAPPPPPPPPPPPGAPPPPPEPVQHDRIYINGPPQGGVQGNAPIWACYDDLTSGLDLGRLPVYAYFADHMTVCDDAMAQINTSLCVTKTLVNLTFWAPVLCYGRVSEANFRQYTKVSRRCRSTQTRFEWRGEVIVYVRDMQGHSGSGVHITPQTPQNGQGMLCR